MEHIEGILPKGPYLPCVSMAGRALLAGYHWYDISLCLHPNINVVVTTTFFCGWENSCPLVTDAKFLNDVITKNRMKKINSRLNSNCQWKFNSEICSWCIDLAICSIMALMICSINHILIIPPPKEVGGGYTGFTLFIIICLQKVYITIFAEIGCFYFVECWTSYSFKLQSWDIFLNLVSHWWITDI